MFRTYIVYLKNGTRIETRAYSEITLRNELSRDLFIRANEIKKIEQIQDDADYLE
jgi:hypothetical protein